MKPPIVQLSLKSYKNKPSVSQIKEISSTILSNDYEVIDIENFAEEISVKGKAVVLPEFGERELRKDAFTRGQQIFMLDFDNKDSKNIYTISDLKKDKWMLNNACFYYRTYSDKESKVDKFRVVFMCNERVRSNEKIIAFYEELFRKYPQSDTTVGQPNRIFFGSTRGYEEINFDNVLNIEELREDNLQLDILNYSKNNIIDENTPNYLLIKYKKFDILKRKLGDNYSASFPDNISGINYFKSIDMIEFLELPTENPFLDILHEETNPSASVYFSKEQNIWYYKVFSQSYKFTGDLVRVVVKLLNVSSQVDALKVLIDITNGNLRINDKLQKQKENSEIFRRELIEGDLIRTAPDVYNYLKRYKYEINFLLEVFYDYTFTDKHSGEVKFINYISQQKLADMVSERMDKYVSVDKIKTVINILTTLEVVEKLQQSEIPKEINEKIRRNQQQFQLRLSNVYSPYNTTEDYLRDINSLAQKLNLNSVTVSSLGFETIYRLFDEKKARKDFPQAYEPLKKHGLIKMDSSDPNITHKSSKFEKETINIIMEHLNTKGYIYEYVLLEKLRKKLKNKKDTTQHNYNKIRASIMDGYYLRRERCNRGIYEKYNVTEPFSTKTIIYKNYNQ